MPGGVGREEKNFLLPDILCNYLPIYQYNASSLLLPTCYWASAVRLSELSNSCAN